MAQFPAPDRFQLALSAEFNDIKIHFENLLGGDALGDTLNNLLSILGTDIWDLVRLLAQAARFCCATLEK